MTRAIKVGGDSILIALFVYPGCNIAGSKVRRDIVEYILKQPAAKRLTLDALIRWYFREKNGKYCLHPEKVRRYKARGREGKK